MIEISEPTETHAGADPATLAFEALREEVGLVRRAVAGLSAERAANETPDYSETLGKILRAGRELFFSHAAVCPFLSGEKNSLRVNTKA